MRIGIVTLAHNNDNFGGTLQAVATQAILRALGHEPFLCNVGPMSAGTYRFRFSHPIRRLIEFRRFLAFVPFWEEHFSFDPAGHRPFTDYVNAPTPADAYLCGSDQIWAPYNIGIDPGRRDFFTLNFGSDAAKRIAYAASLGTERFLPDFHEALRPRLARLNAIGVREASAIQALAEVGRADAQWVCDPVLLHPADFWNAFADRGDAVYSWPRRLAFCPFYRWATLYPQAKALAQLEHLGLHVRIPFATNSLRDIPRTCSVSPEAWLSGLRASEGILTNSYHAMLFSILFHKPFCVLAVAGKFREMNARFRSIVDRLGLTERIIDDQTNPRELAIRLQAPIDWTSVDARLAEWRTASLAFLKDALTHG